MTNIKSWIEERRASLANDARLIREDRAQDAYMEFPRALSAIEAVLELHTRSDMVRKMPLQLRKTKEDHLDYHWCNECGCSWPCATVQAIEGVINE